MFSTRLLNHRHLIAVALLTALSNQSIGQEAADATKDPKAESNQSTVLLTIDQAQASLMQNVFIAAPMPGVVSKVDVAEGDTIDSGNRVVLISDEQASTELDAAKAAYEAARLASANDVDQRYAQRTLEVRQREFQQSQIANRNYKGTVSNTEIEKLRLVVDQSELAIEQAAHDLQIARANAIEKLATVRIAEERLKKHGIESTVAGIVTEVSVEAGEWVEAGKPIVRVISLDPLRIECFVDGRKHGMELIGMPVRFQPKLAADADPIELSGKVSFVSPELHAVTGQVRLWATVQNPNRKVLAGMVGKLHIDKK